MNLSEIYEQHHAEKGRFGFSVLENERYAWFAQHMPKGGRMLDLGCRDGALTRRFLNDVGHITGVDVDPSAIRQAQKNIPQGTFLQMDLLGNWKELEDKKFDVILCSEVLEHVYDPASVVSKLSRLLAPGGVFIGSVPNAFFLKHRFRYLLGRRRCTPLEDPTHITQFNREELNKVLHMSQGHILIEGYTRPPLALLARSIPSVFAFDFLFMVQSK